jgi:hypothetical protein
MISTSSKTRISVASAMMMAACMVGIVGSWNLFWTTTSLEQFVSTWPVMFLRSWIIAAPVIYFLRPIINKVAEHIVGNKWQIKEY